jgi:hypothetical protein
MKTKMIAMLLFLAANAVMAQADLGGLTGKYFAADGLEYQNMMKMQKKQKEDIEIKFIGEEKGSIANKLILKWKGGELTALLDEKLYNKKKTAIFRQGEMNFIMLEMGILALTDKEGNNVGDVLAKDKSKLKDFDIDTAKALVDELMADLNSGATSEKLTKLMKSATFKGNIGKVVFSDNRQLFGNPYGLVEYEDKKHIKSQIIGKPIWINFYTDVNVQAKYGKSAEMNIEYEIEGVKKDRKSLAKMGREWAESIPKIEATGDGFMFSYGRAVADATEKRFDYGFLALMSDKNDKLMFTKSYNMKVTVYVYKDGANVAKIAEGTIALKYEPESKEKFDLWKEWIDSM